MKQAFSALAVLLTTLAVAPDAVEAQIVANGTYYVPPSWSLTLPVNQRFIVLANFEEMAVLDRETGLVWERRPNTQSPTTWASARLNCYTSKTGSRGGWRLPTFDELASLDLRDGHPFLLPDGLFLYWTSTMHPPGAQSALTHTGDGSAFSFAPLDSLQPVWCVRGGARDR